MGDLKWFKFVLFVFVFIVKNMHCHIFERWCHYASQDLEIREVGLGFFNILKMDDYYFFGTFILIWLFSFIGRKYVSVFNLYRITISLYLLYFNTLETSASLGGASSSSTVGSGGLSGGEIAAIAIVVTALVIGGLAAVVYVLIKYSAVDLKR